MYLFLAGSYIQKLTPMFQLPADLEDNPLGVWNPQKVSNIHCMVQLVRALVAPGNPAQVNYILKNIIRVEIFFRIKFH